MADTEDKVLVEKDDDEVIVVETDEQDGAAGEQVEGEEPEADTAGADEPDDEDARLAGGDADEEDERRRRPRLSHKERKESQRRAKERTLREVEALRRENAVFSQRLAELEGRTLGFSEQNLDGRIAQLSNDLRLSEEIIAKATEAGNGQDVVAAMRVRDAVIADIQQTAQQKQQVQQTREQPAQQFDPRVSAYAKQWVDANPWYDPRGLTRESALTKAIDAEILREGYDPASEDYWEELSARVEEAFNPPEPRATPKHNGRKAPPVGASREQGVARGGKEIHLSPARVSAMKEAGLWDDPKVRAETARAYAEYDRNNASR